MKTAIVHHWLIGMRGGERVLEEMCKLYPDADIFTHVYDPERISPLIKQHKITTSFINKLPMAARHYQKYLGFMPRALEQLDLSGYELIISIESGPSKGIIPDPGARHICYCNSPMRYIWDEYHTYSDSLDPISRFIFSLVAHKMRMWDVTTASRVDAFISNSSFAAARVKRFYGRDSDVVFPPVDTSRFAPSATVGDFFLFASQLVPYKKADLAIEAFRQIDAPLVIVGDGSERAALEKTAPPNVKFLGRVSDEKLAELYAQCRALVFPGQEDFGIVPLEAMAAGRPVIAYGKGGALDTVIPNVTGLFFDEQTPASLIGAITRFRVAEKQFNTDQMVAQAAKFSQAEFRANLKAAIDRILAHGEDAHPEPAAWAATAAAPAEERIERRV